MRLLKILQRLSVAVALIVATQTFVTTPVEAGVVTTTTVTSSSNGGWIVGGIFISVASIIACAMIVGAEEDREMTLEEALLSGAIPLGCLLREELGVSPE